jgi:hypothetical protein
MRADKGPIEWNAISQTKFQLRFDKKAPGLTEELPLYYVPAGSLGFSVVVFICVACTCVVILLIRRAVVKGELGGSAIGRTVSCTALCSLWLVYIIMSTLQAYGLAGLGDVSVGSIPEGDLDTSVQYWLI